LKWPIHPFFLLPPLWGGFAAPRPGFVVVLSRFQFSAVQPFSFCFGVRSSAVRSLCSLVPCAFSFVFSFSTLASRLPAFAVDFCSCVAPPLPGLSKFEVGCWMLDVGCFGVLLLTPISPGRPPRHHVQKEASGSCRMLNLPSPALASQAVPLLSDSCRNEAEVSLRPLRPSRNLRSTSVASFATSRLRC
jgi:hypothetical protein